MFSLPFLPNSNLFHTEFIHFTILFLELTELPPLPPCLCSDPQSLIYDRPAADQSDEEEEESAYSKIDPLGKYREGLTTEYCHHIFLLKPNFYIAHEHFVFPCSYYGYG